jgi:hypothetical protein
MSRACQLSFTSNDRLLPSYYLYGFQLTGNGSRYTGSCSLLLVGIVEGLLLFDEVGSSLRQGGSRTFILIVALIITAFFPLGMVLGVLTIWKLFHNGGEQRQD